MSKPDNKFVFLLRISDASNNISQYPAVLIAAQRAVNLHLVPIAHGIFWLSASEFDTFSNSYPQNFQKKGNFAAPLQQPCFSRLFGKLHLEKTVWLQ
jgi:hypothetical protein